MEGDADPQGRPRRPDRRQGPRKTGRVLRTDPKRRRVFVEGLNMVKRHQRPRSVKDTQQGGEAGGIIDKEGPIHISNVMLLDPRTTSRRASASCRDDDRRKRVAKRTGTAID